MAEQLPRAFGDYVLERRLGVGGMAETFAARRGAMQQRVCVKRVLPAFSCDPDFVRQFQSEARLAGRLRHSNVVGVVDFGLVEDELYLALELVEGVDLRALLLHQPERRLPEDVAALIALELAYALEYAHAEQIVHRDVTPSNVLLSVRGEVKLADFGVAKALTSSAIPTASGVHKGKVPYMAPEQMKGGAIDGRTDVFSLGVTLFEMLAGRRPYVGAHDVEVMMRMLGGERPTLRELVTTAMEPVVELCLAADPSCRPTAGELVQLLAPTVRADSRSMLTRLVQGAFDADASVGTDLAASVAPLASSALVGRAPEALSVAATPMTHATSPQRASTRPRVGVAGAANAQSGSGEGSVEPIVRVTGDGVAGEAVGGAAASRSTSPSVTLVVGLVGLVGLLGALAVYLVRSSAVAERPAAIAPRSVEATSSRNEPPRAADAERPSAPSQAQARAPSAEAPEATTPARADQGRGTPRTERSRAPAPAAPPVTANDAPANDAIELPAARPEPVTVPVEPVSAVERPPEARGAVAESHGRVRVSLVPWGEVWVGERFMGRAPVELSLPAGNHTIRIGMGRPTRSERIRVVSGALRDVEFVFED